jgi:uncharacterized damage-inducible protein DinB
MRLRRGPLSVVLLLIFSSSVLHAQSSTPAPPPNAVMIQFERFADIFGSRLVAAFDSIPAAHYAYRPTAAQQSVGYIAQHLEDANYGLCERLTETKHEKTAKDALADTLKARWPKDTLVARLRASLRFCDTALDGVKQVNSAALASTLLAFETDLAEHYSQISVYMRLLNLVPPSALAPVPRVSIATSRAALVSFVGTYEITPGQTLVVTQQDSTLAVSSNLGGAPVRVWAASATEFFVKDADAQITFTKDAAGVVTGLVLHQFGRDRPAKKLP